MLKHDQALFIRVGTEHLEHLDRVRAGKSRSAFIRDLILAQPAHRHVRANKIREQYEKGLLIEVWACACGKEMQ